MNKFTPNPGEDIDNKEVVSTLNGLIETCRDGQQGFMEADEHLDGDIKTLFFQYSQQRAGYVGDLQALVQTLGDEPENSGSFSGTIRRGWMNLKAAITGNDEAGILVEAERGEDAAKHAYEKALETKLPEHIRNSLQTQYAGVQEAHDKVKALRDAAKANIKTNVASTRFN
jgi:uncharacterized protein (TIGR02284 family)